MRADAHFVLVALVVVVRALSKEGGERGDSCIEGFVHAVSSLGHFLELFVYDVQKYLQGRSSTCKICIQYVNFRHIKNS